MLSSNKMMTKKMITIHPEASMLEAYRLMYMKEIRHLPVFDDKNNLVGMLSDRDVQRAMRVDKTSETSQTLSLNSTEKVSDFMSWPVHSVLEETPLVNVIQEVMAKKISAVMIVGEAGNFSGIITTEDLLNGYLNLLNRLEELKEKSSKFFLPNVLF